MILWVVPKENPQDPGKYSNNNRWLNKWWEIRIKLELGWKKGVEIQYNGNGVKLRLKLNTNILTSTWTSFHRAISLQVSRFVLHENSFFFWRQNWSFLTNSEFLKLQRQREPKAVLSFEFKRSKFVVTGTAGNSHLFGFLFFISQSEG